MFIKELRCNSMEEAGAGSFEWDALYSMELDAPDHEGETSLLDVSDLEVTRKMGAWPLIGSSWTLIQQVPPSGVVIL